MILVMFASVIFFTIHTFADAGGKTIPWKFKQIVAAIYTNGFKILDYLN